LTCATTFFDGVTTFEIGLMATAACYLGAVFWLRWGLSRARAGTSPKTPAVSVVVAARNEEEQIIACLDALRQQEYPGGIEVIVVNDRSKDRTAALVLEAAREWPELKLVDAPLELRFSCPKKSALAAGIEQSSANLLLFTDADCQPPSSWVRSTVAQFEPEVGLVAGYAYFQQPQLLRHKLLALDNLAVGALGAGSFGMGVALSATGRNLAYRRAVYDEVGGFTRIGHLMGGDDVYFARLVRRCTAWKIRFNRSPEAAVTNALPPRRWGEILQQKLRHAGKAGHYRGAAKLLGSVIYLFHACLAVGMIKWVIDGEATGAVVWVLRSLAHITLLWRFAARSERRLLLHLPLMEVLYIPYILIFTVLGWAGRYSWKPVEFKKLAEV
jgi:biofilm PGA synthesis N-glycosyltransferase PgaC